MDDIKVGFTGTQRGMTRDQMNRLASVLDVLFPNGTGEFHHGDCIGADSEVHAIVREKFPQVTIIGHPCTITSKRAFRKCDQERTILPPLVRNKKIVSETDLMVACPQGHYEELRSGTWSTVRHARKMNRKVILVTPRTKTIHRSVSVIAVRFMNLD